MLQRVRDLKVQFNNGTLDDDGQGRDRGRGLADRQGSQVRSSTTRSSTADRLRLDDSFTFQVGANDNETISVAPTGFSGTIAAGGLSELTNLAAASAWTSVHGAGDRRRVGRRSPTSTRRSRTSRRSAASYGAVQNRLEHRLTNLATYQENLTASGVAHPRRRHGVGDDQVHEAEHPAAGRHEHARAGQPGAAGRPVAAALVVAVTRRSPLKVGPSGPIFVVKATWSRRHSPIPRSTRSVESWAFVFRTTSRRSTRIAS